MHISWLGEACFKIEVKSNDEELVIVSDPLSPEKTGLKMPRTLITDIVLISDPEAKYPVETKEGKKPFVIAGPGEYEVKGIFIYVIPLLSSGNGRQEYVFWIEAENIALLHTGNLSRVPTETELQSIEGVDVLFAPVGGGQGLDGKKTAEIVSETEPRIVIPMMFNAPGLKRKADSIEAFLKIMGVKSERLPKLKISRKDLPIDETKVIVLDKI